MNMENLYIAATPSSPEVDFRLSEHCLLLKGESYPENAAAFYTDVLATMQRYLAESPSSRTMTVNVQLTYFNSSSTKILFTLFGMLNEKAAAGKAVVVNWYHDPDDEMMCEFGEEMRDDFSHLDFQIHASENSDGS